MKIVLLALASLGLLGCNLFEDEEDNKDEKAASSSSCSFGTIGCGKAYVASSSSVELDLSGVEGTYVISPFSIGNTANVNGGSTQKLVFSSQSFLTDPSPSNALDQGDVEDKRKNLIHLLTTRLTEKSYNTKEYQLLLSEWERLDTSLTSNLRFKLENALDRQREYKKNPPQELVSSDCSLTSVELVYDTVYVVSQSSSGEGFCIYLDDGSNVDTQALGVVIAKIVSNYKKIFNDEFLDAAGFKFRPNFIFADYGGTDQDGSVGFFDPSASESISEPVLVFSAVDERSNQEKAGTIAHELLHAIEYYFKQKRNSVDPEPSGIAEGLAHFFQDVFGDGSSNFSGYVNQFLSSWTTTANGTVGLPAAGSTNAYRGAAAAFIYYLASRNGNFSKGDGYMSGSGVTYIANYIKSDSTGAKGLDKLLGGDLVKVFGEFGAALVVGGSSIEPNDTRFQFDDSLQHTDPFGGQATFGFTPNDDRGIGDKLTELTDWYDPADGVNYEIPYYTFLPRTISGGKSITFELEDAGLGAFAVRVK